MTVLVPGTQLGDPDGAELYASLNIRDDELKKSVSFCDAQQLSFEEQAQLLRKLAAQWGFQIELATTQEVASAYPIKTTLASANGVLASASTPNLQTTSNPTANGSDSAVADVRSLQQLSARSSGGSSDQEAADVGSPLAFSVTSPMSALRAMRTLKTGQNLRKMQKGELNTMDWIIKTLQIYAGEDEEVAKVIDKLQNSSGGDLWEADFAQMKNMPAWLQEQNSAYMQKKKTEEFFYTKHSDSQSEAYELRKDKSYNIGVHVEVIKQGSWLGKTAVVTIPDWNGRVQVRMDEGDNLIKSYLANELKTLQEGFMMDSASIELVDEHKLIDSKQIDEWGFDVLGLQQKLLLRESARQKSRRLPRVKGKVVKESAKISTVGAARRMSGHMDGAVVGATQDVQHHDGVLCVLGIHLFHRHRCSALGVQDKLMLSFLQKIEQMYNPCSYHNSMHGADAMRTIHYFYVNSKLGTLLTPMEKFAGLLAGAVHDVQHPGTNNNFVIATSHHLAITYNDQSPLENMHCATAFSAAKDTMVLDSIPHEDKLMLRKQIVNMVLDTDLARHFSSLAKFKQRIKAATATVGGPNVLSNVMGDNDGRLMTMCMIMKTADIAHAAKPWVLHEKWSKRILLEFFAQGDAERRRGMPVSSLCDRETTDAWKAQTGFIDFLAMPLFEATATLLRDFEGSEEEWRASSRIYQDVVIGSKTNRETWAKKEAAGESQYKYKDQEALRSTLFELELGILPESLDVSLERRHSQLGLSLPTRNEFINVLDHDDVVESPSEDADAAAAEAPSEEAPVVEGN